MAVLTKGPGSKREVNSSSGEGSAPRTSAFRSPSPDSSPSGEHPSLIEASFINPPEVISQSKAVSRVHKAAAAPNAEDNLGSFGRRQAESLLTDTIARWTSKEWPQCIAALERFRPEQAMDPASIDSLRQLTSGAVTHLVPVMQAALETAGRMGFDDPVLRQKLRQDAWGALNDDLSPKRTAGAQILGAYGTAGDIAALEGFLATESYPKVRAALQEAIVRLQKKFG